MARFDELDAMGDSIGKVYADCADRLLVNIARHFKYLHPGEEPGGAFQWQARKLAELGQVNRENVEIIRRMLGDVPAELAEGLEQAIMDALADSEEPLRKAAAGRGTDRVRGRRRAALEAGHLRCHDQAEHVSQREPGGVLGAE